MWLAIALLACTTQGVIIPDSADSAVGTDTSTDTGSSGSASEIWPDCGPADGAALRLGMDPGDAQSCEVAVAGAHQLSFYLWRNLPANRDLPATLTIGTDHGHADGSATYCADPSGGTACVEASSGQIVFSGYVQGTSAEGSYTLDLANGTHREGRFSATWCAHPMMCG
jgi:hypothetical protein